MSSLSYKPLRKSVHLTQITDEEIRWKMQNRIAAGRYFAAKGVTELPPAARGTIVSDSVGKVEHIMFTVPGYYDQKNPEELVDPLDKSHFTSLIGNLSAENRKYTVLCQATQYEQVNEWFSRAGVPAENVCICVSIFNYSIWAQDAYIALHDNSHRITLAESICFTRDHDMTIADDLALQTSISAYQSPLYFQGGNLLATRDYALLGMDYVRENEGRPGMETSEKVIREFEKLLNKSVIAVGRQELILHRDRQYLGGGVFQPVFHIDMYVTSTGVDGPDNKEVLFVASPRLARQILGENEKDNDFDFYFDEVADQLSDNFHVKRMPILPTQFKSKETEWPRHYYLSYNNALVENYTHEGKERRYVYLPSFSEHADMFRKERYLTAYYGDKKRYEILDNGAKKVWEDLGFEVKQMDAMEDLAMSWGSVHCMVKVLQRS